MFCSLFFSVWGKWLIWNHTYSLVSPALKILRRRRISVMLSSVLVTDHVLLAGGRRRRTCRKPTKAQGQTYKLQGHSHTKSKSLQLPSSYLELKKPLGREVKHLQKTDTALRVAMTRMTENLLQHTYSKQNPELENYSAVLKRFRGALSQEYPC